MNILVKISATRFSSDPVRAFPFWK